MRARFGRHAIMMILCGVAVALNEPQWQERPMTAKDPYEDDFLNVPQASDAGHAAQDADSPTPDQVEAGPNERPTLRRFDEEAFLDIQKLEHDPAQTIELHPQRF